MVEKLKSIIIWLTIEQWEQIDRDYKKENSFNMKVFIVFIIAAINLIVANYYGKVDFICSFDSVNKFFSSLPYPNLWGYFYWAIFNVINFFLFPYLVIKFIYKENVRDYGFHMPESHKIHLLYVVMFFVVLPLVYLVSFSKPFLDMYPFYKEISSIREILIWEGAYGLQFLMLEFFFRGFLLFALARYMGSYAIFFMTIPYVMIHFNKPAIETFGAIITGAALGTLALRTKSIYGGVIIHVSIAWSMDFFALMQKGQLMKIFKNW